jgi:hypothetical protein
MIPIKGMSHICLQVLASCGMIDNHAMVLEFSGLDGLLPMHCEDS